MKILVIAAHPDDEILGCGGAILKHVSAGDEVYACIVTTSYQPKWSDEYRKNKLIEAKKVDNILGIKDRFYCNLMTARLNLVDSSEINDRIYSVISKVEPDVIYTHFGGDIHEDHRVIFNSVMTCTRPIEKHISVRCFETLSSTEWGTSPFHPNLYIDINGFVEKKIEAFLQYESEVKEYPHPRSPEGIANLSKKRGSDICVKAAESFISVRDFWI